METLGDQGSGRMAGHPGKSCGTVTDVVINVLVYPKVSKQLHVNYTVIEEASLIILDELPFLKKTFTKSP